ncbi:hypothetical protein RJD24_13145 [Bacillaceae bacterium IKA-2]|nr:hypothetical protein RJD24_13145 [Bacillaceae bacterium IKA-2]
MPHFKFHAPLEKLNLKKISNYISCPHYFNRNNQFISEEIEFGWLSLTQVVVNDIASDFFQLSYDKRIPLEILRLINNHFEQIDIELFYSKVHYYTVLAKMTDYLMTHLLLERDSKTPLFLFEKKSICQMNRLFNLTIDVDSCSPTSFIIKKYLVEADEKMLESYWKSVTYFSQMAFGKIPERIEVISLDNGRKYTFNPNDYKVERMVNSNCFSCGHQANCFEED